LSLPERERLIADLGPHKVLILRNHGLLTAGASVGEAYTLMAFLEKACAAQLRAMAATSRIVLPPNDVAEHTAQQFEGDSVPAGTREWPAELRRLDRLDPGYRD
jgi:ribulose-5-phosphate 4-epimerase/fuculose-1-phosphate aldolase